MATITPFRYAGSKNKLLKILTPEIDKIFQRNKCQGFADVFVGGGSVLLEIANKYPNIYLFANDKDYWIYCFWKIVSDENVNNMNKLLDIMKSSPTISLFNEWRANTSVDEIECAYKAIFFNRTTFSGILTSGPIGGQEQRSKWAVNCRYNYDKLKNKILKCHDLLVGRTKVSNNDFINYKIMNHNDILLYCDPPYFEKGNMLYREGMSFDEHKNLSNILSSRPNWILSYDDHIEIRKLYKDKNIIDLAANYCINGKKNNWKKKNELIITSEKQ
jgi:DNA adenine methylase